MMVKTIVDRTVSLLSHRFFPLAVLFIAVLLAWPLIHTGWFADDIYQRAAYVDRPEVPYYQPLGAPLKGPMMMYSFLDGDPERFQKVMDLGGFPWWCSPDIRAALWRPITGLFSMLDFWLWPQSPELMHVQSMLWFAVLIIISNLVYRKIMGPGWAAGFAVLLYIINDIQVVPIAFLANRHILIAAVFGIASIGAYFQWRRQNRLGWAYVSGILYTLSLFASESGIAVFGYLMSYSLWIERGKIRSRIIPLTPFIIITIAWRILYKSLGYGISGVEFYVDPGNEPLLFVYAIITKTPMLLLHCLAFPPSDIAPIAMVLKLYWVLVVIMLIYLGYLFFPLYRTCRLSLFWLFGTLFAVIPLCAAVPGGRSLALASFGMTGFLVHIIHNAFKAGKARFIPLTWHSITVVVLFGLVIIRLIVGVYNLNQGHKLLQWAQQGIDTFSNLNIDDPELIHQDVILVNPPLTIFTVYIISNQLIINKPLPMHFRTLCNGIESIELTRSDSNTLVVRPKDGYMCPPKWNEVSLKNLCSRATLINSIKLVERLLIKRKNPFTLGQTFDLTGVSIEISELTEDNRPMEATFIFNVPLENQSLRWLQWNKKEWKWETFTLPEVGESVTLK